MNLYEILGVSPNASKAVIIKAYRKLAMKHHPDRGGDKGLFQQIQNAYDVLSDTERRTRYDATGNSDAPVSAEEAKARDLAVAALQIVRGALIKTLMRGDIDVDKVDLLVEVRQMLKASRREVEKETRAQIEALERRKDKAERAARRITANETTLADLMAGISAELDGPLVAARLHLDSETTQLDAALELLKDATYLVEPETPEEVEARMRQAIGRISMSQFGEFFGPGRRP